MHIRQELFATLLLLQMIDASLTQLNRDRRSPKILNISLAGNRSTQFMGRVEIQGSNGTWGTICDDDFDVNDASVVCRMLGFTSGYVFAYLEAHFGQSSEAIWLDNLECYGNETDLGDCEADAWGNHNCHHDEDAGVACGLDAAIQNIRLAGRRGAHEGRVEILGPDGKWGTLVNIDEDAAKVICRMSGFHDGYDRIFYSAFWGEGSGPTYECVNYRSTGLETNIMQCCTSGFNVNYYGHDNDIGVSCRQENDIRLVGGNSELEGRVEVYHNGLWGTVCNNGFDYRDAEVICYMLGYDTRSIQLYTSNRYGSGTGQIWLNNLSCSGTESKLDECPSLTWGNNSCSHIQDVGVDCHQRVRLYGGRYRTEGYVQTGNDWQTICGYNMYENEARAVCHSLHFNTSYWYPKWYSQYIYVNISNTRLSCRGTESDVAECKQGRYAYSCNYARYLNCTDSLEGRLVGGAHSWEGKLQIRNKLDYRWYRVCTNIWTDKEATLFCQLISSDIEGEVYGRVIRSTAFDNQNGSFVFLSTQCNGGLPYCIFEVNSTERCPYTDIAMSCAHRVRDSQNSVRLGGQNEYEGRVEIKFITNTWYTLCGDSWDQNDAVVVCRSLGYWVSSSTAYTLAQGSVPSLRIYPYCNNDEPSIFDCSTGTTWVFSSCPYFGNAGVRCTPNTLGIDKVRLNYGSAPSNGKLEVRYKGQWGGVCMKSWTQMNTEVVCRMMMYNSSMPYYSAFKGISTTIRIGDLHCRGDEADIGLCKAFLDKGNCTDQVVGIDCFGINECLSFPCEHGGNCTKSNGTYLCNCPSGWQGKNCSKDINECLNSPCENGGYCINTNGTYSCDCPRGWQGKDCTTDENECLSFPCQHGGRCNNVDGTYWCDCPIGWQGRNCSTDVNECLSYPCEHGGTCINTNGTYSCDCPCGWQGKDCSTDNTKLSTTPETAAPSDSHHVSPATYESTQELIALRAAVGSLAGLLAISVLLICCLIRKIRRMQKKTNKERPHANPKTALVVSSEYYDMSVQDNTKIRNNPEPLCTISGKTPSNESLSEDHVYTTLDIVETSVEK